MPSPDFAQIIYGRDRQARWQPTALPRGERIGYRDNMARAAKLKVFRTPIGFHDAYIAAPTKKAAIEAWGTGKDVFTRGEAEIVTDPQLTKEPLARPGEVIKRLRGTAAEQLAALGRDEPPAPRRGKTEAVHPKRPAKPAKPKPRPSRAKLDEAEAALAEAEARHKEALAGIEAREKALAREREALEQKVRAERDRLEARRAKAEAVHEDALQRWREA